MERFDPPGMLTDLDDAELQAWSDWISEQIDEARAGRPDLYDFDAPRPRFFNQLTTPVGQDTVEKDITWGAFPRLVALDSATDEERWQTADSSRDVQDEYCEWSIDRVGNQIKRVTFTCEGPEYWQFLAAVKPATVLALYRQHVSPTAANNDLFGADGSYDPKNKWNSTTKRGAMHLVQRNNTLGAEIELAGGASNARMRNGVLLTDAHQLILCGAYGQPERHSDPAIGAEVNALARANADITLANPVGIYFAGLSTTGWVTPDNSDPASYWKITRGTAQKPVRAVYEVPAEHGFAVSDIKINGKPIQYGAQIADFITMKLTGVATRLGAANYPPLSGCKRRAAHAHAAAIDVASVIEPRPPRR
ncbi:hypothetical protein [Vineibacter terrae]|nr:hypothetical protein [Vineibacter terrae]